MVGDIVECSIKYRGHTIEKIKCVIKEVNIEQPEITERPKRPLSIASAEIVSPPIRQCIEKSLIQEDVGLQSNLSSDVAVDGQSNGGAEEEKGVTLNAPGVVSEVEPEIIKEYSIDQLISLGSEVEKFGIYKSVVK